MNLFINVSILIFTIFFDIPLVKGQTYKHIDRFEVDRYYLAFTNGTGKLKDTIIRNQGLRVSYYFDRGAKSYFTL
ncbi:MAG TPA: hypothetical protein VIH57_00350 [Bacteroidales bacterium]